MSLSQRSPARSLRRSQPRRAAHALVPTAAPARPLPERRYWVEHCEGFRVDGAHGRIGLVEDVRRDGAVCVLVIRTGLLGRRVLQIPASEVFEIVPRARKLWLRTPEASAPASAGGCLEAPTARAAA